MACLIAPISGAYSVAWNSLSMGKDENGLRLISRNHQAPVRSDYYGDSLLDLIYRGQDCTALFTSLEYNNNTLSAAWPWVNTWGYMGTVGVAACASSIAKALVATAVAGTPAAAAPASITATEAIIAEGHNFELFFGNQLRNVPLAWSLLPYTTTIEGSPTTVWFQTT